MVCWRCRDCLYSLLVAISVLALTWELHLKYLEFQNSLQIEIFGLEPEKEKIKQIEQSIAIYAYFFRVMVICPPKDLRSDPVLEQSRRSSKSTFKHYETDIKP
jgi:hypothetical protein